MQIFLDIFSWVCQVVSMVVVAIFYVAVFCSMIGLFLAIFLGPPILILRLPQWISSHKENNIGIKYSTFKNMHNINPKMWDLKDDEVIYKSIKNDTCWSHEVRTYFYFTSYIDYFRYRRFLKTVHKQKNLEEQKRIEVYNCKELERVCDCWQHDIEKYKKDSEIEINRKLNDIHKWQEKYKNVNNSAEDDGMEVVGYA